MIERYLLKIFKEVLSFLSNVYLKIPSFFYWQNKRLPSCSLLPKFIHVCVSCLDSAPFFDTVLLSKHLRSPALTTASCVLPWTFISALFLLPVWQEALGQLTTHLQHLNTQLAVTKTCASFWNRSPKFSTLDRLSDQTQSRLCLGWSGRCRHCLLRGHDLYTTAHSSKAWPSRHKACSRNAILEHVCNPVERMIVCPGAQLNVFKISFNQSYFSCTWVPTVWPPVQYDLAQQQQSYVSAGGGCEPLWSRILAWRTPPVCTRHLWNTASFHSCHFADSRPWHGRGGLQRVGLLRSTFTHFLHGPLQTQRLQPARRLACTESTTCAGLESCHVTTGACTPESQHNFSNDSAGISTKRWKKRG